MSSIEDLQEQHNDKLVSEAKEKLINFVIENDYSLNDVMYLMLITHTESFMAKIIDDNAVPDEDKSQVCQHVLTSIEEILNTAIDGNIFSHINNKLDAFLKGFELTKDKSERDIMKIILLLTMTDINYFME